MSIIAISEQQLLDLRQEPKNRGSHSVLNGSHLGQINCTEPMVQAVEVAAAKTRHRVRSAYRPRARDDRHECHCPSAFQRRAAASRLSSRRKLMTRRLAASELTLAEQEDATCCLR